MRSTLYMMLVNGVSQRQVSTMLTSKSLLLFFCHHSPLMSPSLDGSVMIRILKFIGHLPCEVFSWPLNVIKPATSINSFERGTLRWDTSRQIIPEVLGLGSTTTLLVTHQWLVLQFSIFVRNVALLAENVHISWRKYLLVSSKWILIQRKLLPLCITYVHDSKLWRGGELCSHLIMSNDTILITIESNYCIGWRRTIRKQSKKRWEHFRHISLPNVQTNTSEWKRQ